MNAPPLTDELARGILAAIRAGGFPHVAAAAYGVDAALWERWLRRGRRKHAREPYRSFARQVEQAQAQARLRAVLAPYPEALAAVAQALEGAPRE